MVIQFFTMYPYTTARGIQWEDSLGKIAKHYLKTWFPVDLLTIIPFAAFHPLGDRSGWAWTWWSDPGGLEIRIPPN